MIFFFFKCGKMWKMGERVGGGKKKCVESIKLRKEQDFSISSFCFLIFLFFNFPCKYMCMYCENYQRGSAWLVSPYLLHLHHLGSHLSAGTLHCNLIRIEGGGLRLGPAWFTPPPRASWPTRVSPG